MFFNVAVEYDIVKRPSNVVLCYCSGWHSHKPGE